MKKRKVERAGSIEEVILFSNTFGATEKAARWFWNKCEGCGWENKGKPIKNWRATFSAWWDAEYFPRNTYPAPTPRKSDTCICCKAPHIDGKRSCKCVLMLAGKHNFCPIHEGKCRVCCGCEPVLGKEPF